MARRAVGSSTRLSHWTASAAGASNLCPMALDRVENAPMASFAIIPIPNGAIRCATSMSLGWTMPAAWEASQSFEYARRATLARKMYLYDIRQLALRKGVKCGAIRPPARTMQSRGMQTRSEGQAQNRRGSAYDRLPSRGPHCTSRPGLGTPARASYSRCSHHLPEGPAGRRGRCTSAAGPHS